MSSLVIASSPSDARAVESIRARHAQLVDGLRSRTTALLASIGRGRFDEARGERDDLAAFGRDHLLPRLAVEADALLAPARAEVGARLLVDTLVAEQNGLADLIEGLVSAATPLEAAATARALDVMLASHLAATDDHLLAVLAVSPAVSLADVDDAVRAGVAALPDGALRDAALPDGRPAATAPAASGCGSEGGSCACGGSDAGAPAPPTAELDARAVPHAIRHATIFGALDAVAPGEALVLVAPHDPLPLLAQLEQRSPGAFTIDYLRRGPDAWRLAFTRR